MTLWERMSPKTKLRMHSAPCTSTGDCKTTSPFSQKSCLTCAAKRDSVSFVFMTTSLS